MARSNAASRRVELRIVGVVDKSTKDAITKTVGGIKSVDKQLGILNKKFEASGKKIAAYAKAFGKINKTLDATGNHLEKIAAAFQAISDAAGAARTAYGQVSRAVGGARDRMDSYMASHKRVVRSIGNTTRAHKKMVDQLNQNIPGARFHAKVSGPRGIGEKPLTQQWASHGAAMSIIGGSVGALGYAIGRGAIDTLGHGAIFERQSDLTAARFYGETASKIAKLHAESMRLGVSKYSPTETSQIAERFGAAGFTADQTLKMMAPVMYGSMANNRDTETTAFALTEMMVPFDIAFDKAEEVMSKYTHTVMSSNTELEDVRETIKKVSTTFKNMGGTFEEALAITGLLSQAGIKGSMAGSAFRQVISYMTQKADYIRSDLGIEMSEYDPKTGDIRWRKFADIMEDFIPVLDSFQDPVERSMLVEGIWGIEGQQAANVIIEFARRGELKRYIKEIEGVSPDLAKLVSDQQLSNLIGDLFKLKLAFQGLFINLYEGFRPVLRVVTQLATGFVTLLKNLASFKIAGALIVPIVALFAALAVSVGALLVVVGFASVALNSFLDLRAKMPQTFDATKKNAMSFWAKAMANWKGYAANLGEVALYTARIASFKNLPFIGLLAKLSMGSSVAAQALRTLALPMFLLTNGLDSLIMAVASGKIFKKSSWVWLAAIVSRLKGLSMFKNMGGMATTLRSLASAARLLTIARTALAAIGASFVTNPITATVMAVIGGLIYFWKDFRAGFLDATEGISKNMGRLGDAWNAWKKSGAYKALAWAIKLIVWPLEKIVWLIGKLFYGAGLAFGFTVNSVFQTFYGLIRISHNFMARVYNALVWLMSKVGLASYKKDRIELLPGYGEEDSEDTPSPVSRVSPTTGYNSVYAPSTYNINIRGSGLSQQELTLAIKDAMEGERSWERRRTNVNMQLE